MHSRLIDQILNLVPWNLIQEEVVPLKNNYSLSGGDVDIPLDGIFDRVIEAWSVEGLIRVIVVGRRGVSKRSCKIQKCISVKGEGCTPSLECVFRVLKAGEDGCWVMEAVLQKSAKGTARGLFKDQYHNIP